MTRIINVREHPEWIDQAADFFSTRWGIDKLLYEYSINASLSTKYPVPRWYLMLRDDKIIGGCGLIDNDFMIRTDFCPWLCGLYIDPAERGQHLGEQLLEHSRVEATKLGFKKVYLNTDHVGYYEKYNWRYIGDFAHTSGVDARVYEADAVYGLEEMSAFFDIRANTYDSHMIDDLGLDEFYEAITVCVDTPINHLLDLGCGTGLELERLFAKFPDMEVTGIDMSGEMLNRLKEKFPDKKLRLVCGSYFDVGFDGMYDCVLSTYSLHHFSEESKLALYKKIHAAVKPGSVFIFGDYTVATLERQQELLLINDVKRREQGIEDGAFYHFDTPFTAETEIRLMKSAGFVSADIIKQWDNTSIIIARK